MDILDALGFSGVRPSATIPPPNPNKNKSVGKTKTDLLIDKGMQVVGTVLLKDDDVAIVTDKGRVNWFKVKDIFK